MAHFLDHTNPSYTLYLSSADKISGNNNDAIFNINWASFLPRDIDQYKINYSFISAGGWYLDNATPAHNFSSCKVVIDFSGRCLSYDTAVSGQSLTMGYAKRNNPLLGNTATNYYSSFFYEHPGKTITKPTQNSINIKIYNNNVQNGILNQLLLNNTTNIATTLTSDMNPWNMIIEFIPIKN
jgi:hypothetical protein